MTRLVFALCCFVLAITARSGSAAAAPIEVRAKTGGLPIELLPQGGSYGARLVVENRSAAPTKVQVALREGGETDPRLPLGMRARFVDGDTGVLIQPGQQREIEVELSPARGRRFHEVYGHVVVTAEDEPDIAAGFHVALPGSESIFTGRHLSLVWLVPLLGALLVLGLRGREPKPGVARIVWIGASAIQLGLMVWAASRFDVLHTRFAGGDGLQLVERMTLWRGLGIEYALGVDGATLALALSVSLIGLLSAALAEDGHAARFGAFGLLIVASVSGAILALDLVLMLAFWLVALIGAVLALASWAGDRGLARGSAIVLGLGFALVAFAVWQISGTATSAYLMDGAPASRVFSLVELAHGGFVPRSPTLLGAHPIKVVTCCLVVGSALTLGAGPFGGFLSATASRAPTSLVLLLGGGVTLLGAHALVRVGFTALPSGSAWAAMGVAGFGVACTLYASLVALVTNDPRRFVALALSASAGAILVGAASLTAAGLQGALLITICRGLVLALCLGVLTMGANVTGSIARSSPMLAGLGVVAWVAAALGPGTLAFAGVTSTIFGALPTLRGLALAEALALTVLAVAALRSYRRAFLAGAEPSIEAPAPPEREMSVVLTAAMLLLVLGLWPRPLLRLMDSSCLDHAQRVSPPGALEIVRLSPGSERVASGL